eukprot:scaffold127648_cov16-Tisochrysis_lutea.AAC.1
MQSAANAGVASACRQKEKSTGYTEQQGLVPPAVDACARCAKGGKIFQMHDLLGEEVQGWQCSVWLRGLCLA